MFLSPGLAASAGKRQLSVQPCKLSYRPTNLFTFLCTGIEKTNWHQF